MQELRDPLKDLDFLLGDLCRDMGFCNRLTAADLLPPGAILSAIAFVQAVVRAEKMNPENEPTWIQQIQARFEARFGASVSRN